MKVTQRTLAHMDLPYSITKVPSLAVGGMPAIVVGSEGDGPLLLLRPPEYQAEVLASAPGGFISLCHVTWAGRPFLIASTMFKPVFKAADCALVAYPLDRGSLPVPERIGPLPYTHRLGLAEIGGRTFLLASTLCGGKDFQEDWSKPGAIYATAVPPFLGGGPEAWKFRLIRAGLSKNHGMDPAVLGGGRRGFLLSAHEGLFFLNLPENPFDAWECEKLASGEYSDAVAAEWDSRAGPNVFTLSPFHGNVLSIHRRTPQGWVRETIDESISFGHVVWSGMLLGKPAVLTGWRADNKQLALYRASAEGGFTKEIVDEGAGPSQIAMVDRGKSGALIFACAHARGEVVCYTITA
jgi:hypothetical protein